MAGAVVPVPRPRLDAAIRQLDALGAEVADRDLRLPVERHHPPAGQDSVDRHIRVPGRVRTNVVTGPEEVTDRTPDGPGSIEGDLDDRGA